MTISYNLDIASSSPLNFFRLIFRWKASIWKICCRELFIWTIVYLLLTLLYRTPHILSDQQKKIFEEIAFYLDSHLNYIPLTFMLGFFVQTIVKRWTRLFQNMGYIESSALYIGGCITGRDIESRVLRRTIARYLCLTQLLVYRDISVRVRKRFATYDSIIEAGFMLEHEKEKIEALDSNFNKYWMPINWAFALVFRAGARGKISCDSFSSKLCEHIRNFRSNLQVLCNHDWVPIPLAYPQLIFLAVYVYFAICLVSRQFIANNGQLETGDTSTMIIPFVSMVEFLILVGWMKVAEVLLNPFGEDDDDFECNFLLDKNLATALCIVDNASNDMPAIQKDIFWSNGETKSVYPIPEPTNPLVGSATLSRVPSEEEMTRMVVRKPTIQEEHHYFSRYASKKWRFGSTTFLTKRPSQPVRSKSTSRILPTHSDVRSKKSFFNLFGKRFSFRHSPELNQSTSELGVVVDHSIDFSPRTSGRKLNSLPTIDLAVSTPYGKSSHKRIPFNRSNSENADGPSYRMTILSTVEEEDPNALTITKGDRPRRNAAGYLFSQIDDENNTTDDGKEAKVRFSETWSPETFAREK